MAVPVDDTRLQNTIVVGVDGSEHALAAAEWAADDAQRRHAALLLLCAMMLPLPIGPQEASSSDFLVAQEEWARSVLLRVSTRVARRCPDLELTSLTSPEFPIPALRRWADRALMTVVGARGCSVLTGVLIGSVAEGLVTHGPGPVVVVRAGQGSQPDRLGPVVVGLDGEASADAVLWFAFQEASFRGVALHAVHVRSPVPGSDRLGGSRTDGRPTDLDQGTRRQLAEVLAGRRREYPDVRVHRHVLVGEPGTTLEEFCAADDVLEGPPSVVVVGSRGRGRFLGTLLGSTSQWLAVHSIHPVCVVHPRRP